jgi:hypothetical protein
MNPDKIVIAPDGKMLYPLSLMTNVLLSSGFGEHPRLHFEAYLTEEVFKRLMGRVPEVYVRID